MKPAVKLLPDNDPWPIWIGRPGYEHQTFEGATQLLPELDILGWLHFHAALPRALPPDRHAGTFEVHYMVRGHVRWWVEDEQHEFGSGHVFIIRPGELHGGDEDSLQPCEHYWLRVRFPVRGALPALTVDETAALRKAYQHLIYRTFPASPEVNEFFERLMEEHRRGRTPHFFPMARSLLHALLICVIRDHDRYNQLAKQKPMVTWRVRRAIEWLENHICDGEVRLESIAESVGMSPAGFRARFKAETGYTLHDYVLHRRIEEARRRLSQSAAEVTTIAHDLGFSSSQYFATAFRRQVGITPVAYRERHGKP